MYHGSKDSRLNSNINAVIQVS